MQSVPDGLGMGGHLRSEFELRDVAPQLPWVRDRVPVEPLSHIQASKVRCIDNSAVIGCSSKVVPEVVDAMEAKLREVGIRASHDEEVATKGQLLGFVLHPVLRSGGRLRCAIGKYGTLLSGPLLEAPW